MMLLRSSSLASTWDDDPRLQAPRAVEIARAHCTCNYPYHVLWPILRAAGIKGTLRAREDEVLAPLLSPLLVDGARVLIAGSADTATLCTVGRMSEGRKPEFTVLDRCPAPLALIREFAAERGISCQTLHVDLIDLAEESRWDVVLAHYTFQFIAPDQRINVLTRLSRALVPGGTLVCVDKEVPRIAPADVPAASADWLAKTRLKLENEGLDSALPAPLYDELLRSAAEGRTKRRVTIASAAELIESMRRTGLVLTQENVVARARHMNENPQPRASDSSLILAASRPR